MEVDPAKHPDLSVSLRLMMRAGFHYEAWSSIKEILTKNDFEINLRLVGRKGRGVIIHERNYY